MSRHAGLAVLGALLVAGTVMGWRWWLASPAGSDSRRTAEATTADQPADAGADRTLAEPPRCPRASHESANRGTPPVERTLSVTAGSRIRTATIAGHELSMEPGEPRSAKAVRVALVADARGRLDGLNRVRESLAKRKAKESIDLVVSLGGLARDQQDIHAALSALVGPWFVLALPGDWEAYEAHREAVEALADRGVLDGAEIRVLRIGGLALLATLPGVPNVARTLAGDRGCVYTDEDVAALPALFAPSPGASHEPELPRVLLSHAPPRQRGDAASDVTTTGVHVGEPALARAITEGRVALAIHGLIAPIDRSRGVRTPLDPAQPIILGAGAADAMADITQHGKWPPPALVITLYSGSISWTYLEN